MSVSFKLLLILIVERFMFAMVVSPDMLRHSTIQKCVLICIAIIGIILGLLMTSGAIGLAYVENLKLPALLNRYLTESQLHECGIQLFTIYNSRGIMSYSSPVVCSRIIRRNLQCSNHIAKRNMLVILTMMQEGNYKIDTRTMKLIKRFVTQPVNGELSYLAGTIADE